jgi:hypothetical protein
MGADKHETQSGCYLTGQVVAAQGSRQRIYAFPTRVGGFFSRPLNMKEDQNENQSGCGEGAVRTV